MRRKGSSAQPEEEVIEYRFDDADIVSSSELLRADAVSTSEKPASTDLKKDYPQLDPVSRELAAFSLPALKGENRAWLQMQSPNRLFFYWSTRRDPFHTLSKAMGDHIGSYTLVAKLIDLARDTEEIHRIEGEGSMWFNADAQTEYRAEIGFYAPNQPFVRVMFSNTVATPRKKPSSHPAEGAEWTTSAEKFARVLDASGFSRDAFEVAVAGDDQHEIDTLSHRALSYLLGTPAADLFSIDAGEIRRALYMLAAGEVLENLRWRVDPSLFAIFQKHVEKLSSESAIDLLREQFGIDEGESAVCGPFEQAVFGSSRVNLPRRSLRRRLLRSPEPVSSLSRPLA